MTFFPTLLVLYLVLNWLPTLVAAKGYAEDASLSSVLFNGVSVLGAFSFGLLVDRFGVRWPLTLGFLGLAGTLIALGRATDYEAIMALSGVLGFFLLGCNYAAYGAAASFLSGRDARAWVGGGDCVGAVGLGRGSADRRLPVARRIGAGASRVRDGAIAVLRRGGSVLADLHRPPRSLKGQTDWPGRVSAPPGGCAADPRPRAPQRRDSGDNPPMRAVTPKTLCALLIVAWPGPAVAQAQFSFDWPAIASSWWPSSRRSPERSC